MVSCVSVVFGDSFCRKGVAPDRDTPHHLFPQVRGRNHGTHLTTDHQLCGAILSPSYQQITPSQRDRDEVICELVTNHVLHTTCGISWDRPLTNRYERDLSEENQNVSTETRIKRTERIRTIYAHEFHSKCRLRRQNPCLAGMA